jgi:DNA mismatch repair protein MutL
MPRRTEEAAVRAAVPASPPASPAFGSGAVFQAHPSSDAPFFAPEYARTGILRSPSPDEQLSIDLSVRPSAPAEEPAPAETSQDLTRFSAKTVEKPVCSVENAQVPPFRLIGEAMKTYLIVESGENLILIDKHAAHERMNFDRLRAQPGDVASQTLLAPVPLRAGAEDAELLSRCRDLLSRLGFEIEPFGDRDHLIRAVPAGLDPAEALPAVEEILGTLRSGRTPDPQSRRDDILRAVACKAAVKAGWDTDPAEMRRLAEEVLSGRVRYCPHGRPVSAMLTRRELDGLFKRIV